MKLIKNMKTKFYQSKKILICNNYYFSLKFIIFFIFNFFYFSNIAQSNVLDCNSFNSHKNTNFKLDLIEIEVKQSEFKKWMVNFSKIINSKNKFIEKKYKKFFNSTILVTYSNGLKCSHEARIKITGDWMEHLDKNNFFSSFSVNLENGNIFNITKFKLFKYSQRNYDNEVFATNILRYFNIMSPRTYFTKVKFFGKLYPMTFQERDVKELLEYHNYREGPIIEGNEKFLFSNKFGNLFDAENISLSRIVNSKYAVKNKNTLNSSINALASINTFYFDHISQGFFKKKNFDNMIFPENISNNDRQKKENVKFEIFMYALNAQHGLRPHNRKFYYDHIINSAVPIYYDGDVKLGKVQIKLFKDDEPIVKELIEKLNQIRSSEKVFKKIREGSSEKFTFSIYQKNIKHLIFNLQNAKYDKKKKHELNLNSHLNFLKNLQNYNDKFYLSFYDHKLNRFHYCDNKLKNCFFDKENKKNTRKILEGNFLKNRKNVIFLGFYNNNIKYKSFDTFNFYMKKLNKKNLNNDLKIKYKDVEVSYNKSEKKIHVKAIGKVPRFLIYDSNLYDHKIIFESKIKKFEKTQENKNINEYNLTGCVTIYNSFFNNIKFDIKNSICEDGLNIVRSKGNIKQIDIKNSYSDAVDLDFSEIVIKNINIENAKNDCLDVSSGIYEIKNINAIYCGDKAISVGEKSKVTINNAKLDNSSILVASKDSSMTKLFNLNTTNNYEKCLSVYKKKQEFNGAIIYFKNVNDECIKRSFFDNYSYIENF